MSWWEIMNVARGNHMFPSFILATTKYSLLPIVFFCKIYLQCDFKTLPPLLSFRWIVGSGAHAAVYPRGKDRREKLTKSLQKVILTWWDKTAHNWSFSVICLWRDRALRRAILAHLTLDRWNILIPCQVCAQYIKVIGWLSIVAIHVCKL